MSFFQGLFLVVAALGVAGISIRRNKATPAKNWKPAFKAVVYLILAGVVLMLTPAEPDIFGGWSTFACFLLAVVCLWIVLAFPFDIMFDDMERKDYQNGSGTEKALYRAMKVCNKIDVFMWKKMRGTSRLRWMRRGALGVLVVACLLGWFLPWLLSLFSSDEPPAMSVGSSPGSGQTTSAAPTTTTVSTPPATTATTPVGSGTQDFSCETPGLQAPEKFDPPQEISFKGVKDANGKTVVWVCQYGNWAEWKKIPVPSSVLVSEWATGVSDGSRPPLGDGVEYAVMKVTVGHEGYYLMTTSFKEGQ